MQELETAQEVVENHDEIAEYEKVSRKSEYRIKLDNQLRELGFNTTDFNTLETKSLKKQLQIMSMEEKLKMQTLVRKK